MPAGADDSTSWERMTATPSDGRRFRPRPANVPMISDALTERSSCLAVVPAYNEAETVGGVVESLHHHAPQLDVVVVDDGSTDDTVQRAEAAGARVLQLPFNL